MRYIFWLALLIIVGLRVIFYYQTKPFYPTGTRIKISDRVMSEPIRYENSQRIVLQGFKFYLPAYPEVNYGDKVVIEGVVEEDKLKKVVLIDFQKESGFLSSLRRKVLRVYQKSLPSTHSALVSGITIGSKATISSDFWEALKKSGTLHVVVASGMNVTLVAGFLVSVLVLFFPRRRAIPLALVGIWFYALISGFDAPIIRAAIMGSIAFAAQELGRLYFAWRALFLSALVMIFIKPAWISDLGFILSFVATASLILFESKVDRLISFVKFPKFLSFLKKDLSTTLAAQVGVAPILLVSFGQFNLLSPLINALVLWTIPLITAIGMIGGVVGLILEPIGRLVLLLTYPLTSWFINIVQMFG